MPKSALFAIVVLIAIPTWSFSQTPDPVGDSKPATTNVRGSEYPRVLPDRRVVFRIKAPDAKSIQIDLGKTYDLTRDSEGLWTVTTEPQGTGFHYYTLIVDGVRVADPASESFYGMGRMASGIEIPYGDMDAYEVQDVPHGDIRTQRYHSTTTGQWRRLFLYAPPGYDRETSTRYPVLYIIHGGGEDARGWAQQGRTDIILDNLIAAGKAKPMLVAMVDANVGGGMRDMAMENFKDELLDDIIPFVERNYRVLADREHRALAGLSMGGLHTLYTGIKHTDLFGALGIFSSGWLPFQQETADEYHEYLEKNRDTVNERLKPFFISQGGREDIAWENNQRMMKRFDEIGIHYEYYEYPGGHTWPVWRDNLRKMAPELFRQER